jgi:hypothetical protein
MKTHYPTHEQIAARAYEIYRQRGGQPGREQDDWLQAEYELLQLPVAALAKLAVPPPPKKKRRPASALISLVQAALLLSATLPRFSR